jgi:hypothetical protein
VQPPPCSSQCQNDGYSSSPGQLGVRKMLCTGSKAQYRLPRYVLGDRRLACSEWWRCYRSEISLATTPGTWGHFMSLELCRDTLRCCGRSCRVHHLPHTNIEVYPQVWCSQWARGVSSLMRAWHPLPKQTSMSKLRVLPTNLSHHATNNYANRQITRCAATRWYRHLQHVVEMFLARLVEAESP